MQRKIDFRLTAMIRSNVLSSTSASGSRSSSMAAAFTAQCNPPNVSTVPLTSASTDRASETSAARKRLLPPALAISPTVSWPASAAMSDTTTSAPASAKAMAIARPIPPAPPVTSATFPAKSLLATFVPFELLETAASFAR